MKFGELMQELRDWKKRGRIPDDAEVFFEIRSLGDVARFGSGARHIDSRTPVSFVGPEGVDDKITGFVIVFDPNCENA